MFSDTYILWDREVMFLPLYLYLKCNCLLAIRIENLGYWSFSISSPNAWQTWKLVFLQHSTQLQSLAIKRSFSNRLNGLFQSDSPGRGQSPIILTLQRNGKKNSMFLTLYSWFILLTLLCNKLLSIHTKTFINKINIEHYAGIDNKMIHKCIYKVL